MQKFDWAGTFAAFNSRFTGGHRNYSADSSQVDEFNLQVDNR
jgi:hypothetical protein